MTTLKPQSAESAQSLRDMLEVAFDEKSRSRGNSFMDQLDNVKRLAKTMYRDGTITDRDLLEWHDVPKTDRGGRNAVIVDILKKVLSKDLKGYSVDQVDMLVRVLGDKLNRARRISLRRAGVERKNDINRRCGSWGVFTAPAIRDTTRYAEPDPDKLRREVGATVKSMIADIDKEVLQKGVEQTCKSPCYLEEGNSTVVSLISETRRKLKRASKRK